MTARHQAALSFLHNISLDGSHHDFNIQTIDENKKINDLNDSTHIDHQLINNIKIEPVNEQQNDEVQAKQIFDRNRCRDKQRLRYTHMHPVALTTTKGLPYAIFSVIPYSKDSKEHILYVCLPFY